MSFKILRKMFVCVYKTDSWTAEAWGIKKPGKYEITYVAIPLRRKFVGEIKNE